MRRTGQEPSKDHSVSIVGIVTNVGWKGKQIGSWEEKIGAKSLKFLKIAKRGILMRQQM